MLCCNFDLTPRPDARGNLGGFLEKYYWERNGFFRMLANDWDRLGGAMLQLTNPGFNVASNQNSITPLALGNHFLNAPCIHCIGRSMPAPRWATPGMLTGRCPRIGISPKSALTALVSDTDVVENVHR